ncbi:helix-turn-helix domain-containing protein [Mangrovibacillus sp. Mu-81]|uniref:helix-turn-helix domain-containing protein n=1 Tax=Mangrovibacillus sp. Mu-81 TaxID=3121478 RepID=UPI002FE48704
MLSRHSCKYPGVSFLTKTNIGKLVGKSRRTIIRVCQRLEEIGVIRQYELRRQSDGQQTSNAIVIMPVKEAPVTQAPSENDTPISRLPSKHINKAKERTASREYVNKPAWIPKSFFALLNAHIDSVQEIEEYWRSVYATTYKYQLSPAVREDIGIQAFYAMKGKRKQLRTPIAFFTGVVKRKAKAAWLNEWLEAI